MDMLKDLLLVTGRIVTIFPLMLLIGLFMGKRSVGELPIFDFLVIIALGAVVGADIADPNIEHIHTAAAIVLIGLLQRGVSTLTIKSRKFGKLITFEPTVVVYKGSLLANNLKKARYSIDNISQMLREKDIFHLHDVELAVLEANGRLTAYKKEPKAAPTREDLGLAMRRKDLSYPLIVEGTVYGETLSYIRKDTKWLDSQLQAQGLRSDDIFYAAVDDDGKIYLSNPAVGSPPPIRH
ncbi:DUF421 domain-containing protein [Cohnella hongkongensis]|uniref:DUF421 domain-containing protein n=1 Tax=Cohnella hongkongensis TaxID=178337 RepID=A0ABV9FD72_9BACL